MAKHWSDEQESHARLLCWVSRPITVKPNTHTESMAVNAAGISVKVIVSYPGRSRLVHESATQKWSEKSADVIVGA